MNIYCPVLPEQIERDIRLFSGRTGQYMFISSASAYQKPPASPWITEETPLENPYWPYSARKAECERVLRRAQAEARFPVTIVRPSHTYGPRGIPLAFYGKNTFSVLDRMRAGKTVIVPGDGSTLWTLTHSRDFAVAFVGLMGNPGALGEAFHITSDESLTWNQIYETVGAALGVQPNILHIASDTLGAACTNFVGSLTGDKSNTVLFDNSKIKRFVPEFHATIPFAQGARECVEYVYAHPECQLPDPAFDRWCDELIVRYESMVMSLPKYSF